ncbi:MAG: DUF2889 domain-containing protein [Firmicutes bacterium]|nr:DUF2889 domain-containing protein [Bacillota bacterium]
MDYLFQCFWHTSICREGKEYLKGFTEYCDSNYEMTASMLVNAKSFIVTDALLEYGRVQGEKRNMVQRLEGLEGMEAYFGCGPELRQGLKDVNDSVAISLFGENVRGIIQAETFLLSERGYASLEAYSKHWDKFYTDSCRYYSNLKHVKHSWSDYVGNDKRENIIFTRFKNQQLYRLNSGEYLVSGSLSDSFHEINVVLSLNGSGTRVIAAKSSFLRVPDAICRESVDYLRRLEGKDLIGLSKKEIAELLGKSQGCVHLIDIVHDAVTTLSLYIKQVDLKR